MSRARSVHPRELFVLAGVTGCVLLAIVLLELFAGIGRATPSARPALRAGTIAVRPAAEATAFLSPQAVSEATRIVLARPLFSPGRRPPSVAVSGPQRPRLAGIIVAPGGRRAIFAGAGDARGAVVGVGQQAGAWHVLAIDDAGVRVSGPDGVRVLRPSRDKGAHDAGAAADADASSHPSILDLLRSRNALPGGGLAGGLMGGRLPVPPNLPSGSSQTTDDQSPQQTAPAAPE